MKKITFTITIIFCCHLLFSQNENDLKLLKACNDNNYEDVEKYLELGANPNAKTWEGFTPLMYASEKGNIEICKLLLEKGADANIQPSWGANALIAATQYNHNEIVELLILNKAKYNLKDDLGYNALCYAVTYGFYEVAETLLYYGASHKMICNNTDPMMIAAFYGDTLMCEILLHYGADINSKDDKGFTPLMIAAQNDFPECVDYLIKKGANINDVNSENRNALSIAVINKNTDVEKILIDSGANVNQVDNQNFNSYSVAILNNDLVSQKILKKAGIEKQFSFFVNKVTFSFLNNFNKADYMFGFDFGLNEARTNTYFYSGILTRPFYKNVIFLESENFYYQLKEKRTNIFLGIEKKIKVLNMTKKSTFGGLIGFRGVFSYGNYRSTYRIIEDNILYNPYMGIYLSFKWLSTKFSYEYCEMTGIKTSPHRFNISMSFSFKTKKINHKNKDLYWF